MVVLCTMSKILYHFHKKYQVYIDEKVYLTYFFGIYFPKSDKEKTKNLDFIYLYRLLNIEIGVHHFV